MKKAEEILFEIDQLRIKYKGQKIDIEEGSKYINEALELLTTWKEDICEKQRIKDAYLIGVVVSEGRLKISAVQLTLIINIILNAPEPT